MHKWMRNENTTWKYCCYPYIPFMPSFCFIALHFISFLSFHSVRLPCKQSLFLHIMCFFLANYNDWPEIQIKDSKYEYEQQITDVIFMAVKQ